MARQVIKMPDIGEGTTEAEIVAWLVRPGDRVGEDDPLAEVMTDKATVEIPAPAAGTIVTLNGKVGEKLPVGSELIVMETDAGAQTVAPTRTGSHPAVSAIARSRTPAALSVAPAPPATPEAAAPAFVPSSGTEEPGAAEAPRPVQTEKETPVPPQQPEMPVSAPRSTPSRAVARKLLASPAVRRRGWDLGIALQFVTGTGPGGRITHQDLDAFIAGGRRGQAVAAPSLARRDGVEDVPVIGLRRVIAERVQRSSRQIPHYSYVEEVDVTVLEELRAHLNQHYAARGHLTVLPFLMRAIVNAVVEHPEVNARFDDDAGISHRHRGVHVGIATQTEAGLTVPVVHHAEALDLWQAAAEIARLAEAARAQKATRDELAGSTITVTSLGALGGLAATPVINYPEVAIVGVNRIAERPVVRQGAVVVRKMMNLSSSFDHRIVDGWQAASFIQRVREYLENPATLFIG